MHEDFSSIFNGKPVPQPEVETEQDTVTEENAIEEVTETTEIETEETTETVEEAAEPAIVEPEKVPAPPGLVEERRKRQEREREVEQLKRDLEALKAQQMPSKAPDPYEDHEAYTAHMQEQMNRVAQQKANEVRFQLSELSAVKEFGAEKVETALDWASQRAISDTAFAQEAYSQVSPVEWVVQQHERHSVLSEFERDPDAFVRRRAAEMGMNKPDAIAPAIAPTTITEAARNKAPKSLASVTSTTAKATPEQSSAESFKAIFNKR